MMGTSTQAQNVANEAFKAMADNFSKAFNLGVQYYEDASKLCTSMAMQGFVANRAQFEQVAGELTRMNKQNMERFQHLFEEQMRRASNLTPYITDPATMSNPADVSERIATLWRMSFESLRDSMNAASKATEEFVHGWARLSSTDNGAAPATEPAGAKKPGK